MIAVILIMAMMFNIPCIPVFAAEMDTEVEEDTITNPDGTITEQKTTTKTEIDEETGDLTVTVTIEKDTAGTTDDGVKYDGNETRVETTVTDKDGNILSEGYVVDGTESKEWTEDVTPEENDPPKDDDSSSSGTNGNGTSDDDPGDSSQSSSQTSAEATPQTGDPYTAWVMLAVLSALCIFGFCVFRKGRA